jgi:pyruvate/2-oxoglutarate/acetoin dehydrogenase E1 component
MVELSYVAAVRNAIDEEMSKDPGLLILGEDVASEGGGVWSTFRGLASKYGAGRVRSTPIAEQAIVGAAIGASMDGHRVIADIMFFDFISVCMDQLVNHAAKLRYMSAGRTSAPITITTTVGSPRFGAQHAQSLESWLMHVPGLKVVFPSDASDAQSLLRACIADDDPCVFIQHSGLLFGGKMAIETGPPLPLGEAAVKRVGTDVTVVTYGRSVRAVMRAASELHDQGIDVEVLDLRTLVPLDMTRVCESVAKTRRAVVVHEATRFSGPGAEIAALINEELFGQLLSPVRRVASGYAPISFTSESRAMPTIGDIVRGIREVCEGVFVRA